jgi:hypothetical protein
MSNEAAYVLKLATWLAQALATSKTAFASFSTASLGTALPDAIVSSPPVTNALEQVSTSADFLGEASTRIEASAAAADEVETIAALVALGTAMGRFFQSLAGLCDAIRAGITPATIPDAADRAAAVDLANGLERKLADLLFVTVLLDELPQLAFLLKIAGLVDLGRVEAAAGSTLSRTYVARGLRLDRFKDLISDPIAHLQSNLKWGANDFDPTDFFELYLDFFQEEDQVSLETVAGDPVLRHGSITIRRASERTPPGLHVAWNRSLTARQAFRGAFTDAWGVGLSSSITFTAGAAVDIDPPGRITIQPPTGEVSGEARLFIDRNEAARPFDVMPAGLISLSLQNASIGAGLRARWESASGRAAVTPLVFSDISGARLRLGSADADSFIASLLASADVEGQFDLGLEWTPDEGLRVRASGGIEIALPIHQQLGPIEFQTLYLALRIQADGTLALEVSTAIAGTLGPLSAAVDRLGILLDLRLADDANADFGPFDLALRFKPPNGIGLGIDAGVVKGGGYVYLDFEKGEYAGILELTIANFLSVKAIGLINTTLPGGQPGFSLLLIITAEFVPGFQLGYGFVLAGVGGLLGLNRSVLLDPLAQGVRTGAVNSILFPTNIIANAPRIISDLRAIFPPHEGTFLIGPMAKIGWGTPVLISLSLGVIIEIPGNVVILGRLRAALPLEEAPVLVLQVTFIGALEFDKRRVWFFASLYESRVLFMTLEGEMGLLMDFSDNPNFVLSVGGFHPQFTAPPLPFPSPARLALTIINESFARIRAEVYFAVTSNTVQMGCRAEAFFGFDAFSVEGYLTFDALLRFSPFYLIVEVSTGFSVKVFGVGVWGVHLRGSLEGPTPWRIRGSAEIEVLFFSFSVDVDVTFGERRNDVLPPIEVLPKMRAELEKLESWRATLPASGRLLVNLRRIDDASLLVLHPVGTLEISQRFAPLNLPLDKIGNQKPSDVKKVAVAVQAGSLAVKGPTREKFAAAQYFERDDAAKLSAPAFELFESGVELTAAGEPWTTGPMADRNVRYEMIIIDTAFERFVVPFFRFWDGLFAHFRRGSSIARSTVSQAAGERLQPFGSGVVIGRDEYAVARQSDNAPYAAAATFGSFAEAQAHMAAAVRANPTLADTIHVIPTAEVTKAA